MRRFNRFAEHDMETDFRLDHPAQLAGAEAEQGGIEFRVQLPAPHQADAPAAHGGGAFGVALRQFPELPGLALQLFGYAARMRSIALGREFSGKSSLTLMRIW